ncbi:MAG: copper resistance protein CopC [Actinomycetota bacterium]|nr:copper resistance protein CopC [Actinomycetota bacterium]
MKSSIVLVAGLVLASIGGPARAHGDLRGTDPEAEARLKKAPNVVTVTLTEPPAKGSTLSVRDGCRKQVVLSSGPDPHTEGILIADLARGRPGRWQASYRAISSVDGHLTRGRFAFTVAGRKDCSNDPDDVDLGGGEDTRVNAPPDAGSSFPLVPFAIGTAAVIVLALVLRWRATSAD